MINILPFLHFFAFLVYFYLIAYLLSKNSKSLLNRVCAAFLGCFALWSLMLTFLFIPGTLKETAIFFDNIASIGWISFASFFLWFALVFTEKKKIIKAKIFYFLIFAIPLFFIYKKWTGFLIGDYIEQSWGWAGIWSNTIWPKLFYLYYLSFAGIGLLLIYSFSRETKKLFRKKQAQIIFVTAFVSLALSTLIEVLLPELGMVNHPTLANIIALIWAGGLVYTMVKYKFMVITTGVVAEKILSTMADSLLLLDENGKIVTVNESLERITGYQEDELQGKTLDLFFSEEQAYQALFDQSQNKEVISNCEATLKTKNGDSVPVIITCSNITDKTGMVGGIVCTIKDISELKHAEQELREEKRLFNVLMGYIPDSIYFKDRDLRFIRVNRIKAEHCGRSPEKMVGLTDFDILSKDTANQCLADDASVLKSGKPVIGKIEKIVRLDKKECWVSVTKVPWHDHNGEIIGLVGISRDITQLKKAEEQLRELSRIDSLIGCYNRRYGLELIQRQIKLAKRSQSPFLLAFFDIDNLKTINDRYGHLEGDAVLTQVANLFKKNLREVDILCRMGGDEFLLAFPDSSLKDVDSIKKRIYAALSDLNEKIKTNANYNIQLSMGFAEYLPDKPKELDELISIADQQMYKEKNIKKQCN